MASASLTRLGALHGSWQGIYQLRGDPAFEGDSQSRATIAPVLGGRFVRIDYTWSDRGRPQDGSLLIGLASEVVTAVWVDSWHNGPRMMVCTGVPAGDGGIDVRGCYPTEPGSPDWGWRTVITLQEHAWVMTMFNVAPGGEESLAVRVDYERANA